MTSKEALDKIVDGFNETTTGINGLGEVAVDNTLVKCYKEELETIQKDLERLEKLEKTIEIMVRCDVRIHAVKQYTYKGYIQLSKYCCCGEPQPTEEEYELLKEVLCGEQNS